MAILDTATAGVDAGVISHIGATNAEPAWLGDLRATATEPQDETAAAPDRLDQQSEQSFPASDAPSWGGLRL